MAYCVYCGKKLKNQLGRIMCDKCIKKYVR